MNVSAVGNTAASSAQSPTSASAFGLDFKSLLQIILTQLTYQDPLKPMDNFQFISQLAQFSQLEQSQELNASVASLLAAQNGAQAVGLLGHKVSLTSTVNSADTATGSVTAVNFSSGQPSLTITTASGQVLANVAISSITTVR